MASDSAPEVVVAQGLLVPDSEKVVEYPPELAISLRGMQQRRPSVVSGGRLLG